MRLSLKSQMEVRDAQALRTELRSLTDDEEAIADTLEGECDFESVADEIITSIQDDEDLAAGIKERISTLRERSDRAKARIDRKKDLLRRVIELAGKRIVTPSATVSLRHNPPKAIVVDEMVVPAAFWRQPDPVVSMEAVNAAWKMGEPVPGTTLDNGSVTVKISTR